MDPISWAAAYWSAVAAQDEAALRAFFTPGALVLWHNSNECFTLDEFIQANCTYPGQWEGAVERVETAGDRVITAARVWTRDGRLSFHAASFFSLDGGLVSRLDEYWGDDGPAPQWRLEQRIGRPIRPDHNS